ncbi:MAG TPA: hypothetical protein EYP81_01205 [Thermodesulfobacteriaceae bacterium]|nr:hypothetical protein [Thermodesulfobacteriaceae bacterium]
MRRGLGLLSGLLTLLALIVIKPLTGSGGLEVRPFSKAPVYDREGRVLFRVKELYKAYYVGELPIPNELKPYLKERAIVARPPYLVARALSAEETKALSGISGLVFERYFRPEYPGGTIFSGVLEALLKSQPYSGKALTLTLSWEIQEALHKRLEGLTEFFRRIGGVVVEIPSGEVYALVSLPNEGEFVPLTMLLPVEFLPKDLPVEVFGEPTGLEISEAPGVFWPGGETLATPVQMARALAAYLCGEAPKLHLIKQETFSGLCGERDERLKKVYNYINGNKWTYLTFWPNERPRFVIVLAGELKEKARFRVNLSGLFKELERYLPPEFEGETRAGGFPDLRGLTLKAALESLGKRHIKVRFRGFGRVVRQEPLPGTPWEKVKSCVLYLRDET